MTKSNKKRTMPIRIEIDVIQKIKEVGFMGETYSDVIRRILKMNKRGESKIKKPSIISDKMDSSLRVR